MTARLQLALDDFERDAALELLDELSEYIDIVEVGTPLLMRYGMAIVHSFKQRFPHLDVLCDAKIVDAARYEARLAFEAGADYVTILAVGDDLSIQECVQAASEYGRKVMADMICVADLPRRARELEQMQVDVIAVHTGADQQARGRTPLDDLRAVTASVAGTPVAVAGGIDSTSAPRYIALNPSILIVGTGITGAPDAVQEAGRMRELITTQA